MDSLRQEINISEQKFKEDLEALKKQLEFERTSRKNIQSQKDNVKTSGDNLEVMTKNNKYILKPQFVMVCEGTRWKHQVLFEH